MTYFIYHRHAVQDFFRGVDYCGSGSCVNWAPSYCVFESPPE
jgi:hypothetical protein